MDDNSANALRLTHHFAGPPALVWAVWTRPELIRSWFGSRHGFRAHDIAVDLRPGGNWSLRNVKGAVTEHVSGTYHEVEPDLARLVYSYHFEGTEFFSVISVDLAAEGDGTRLHFLQTGFPDAQARIEHARGWPHAIRVMGEALLAMHGIGSLWPKLPEKRHLDGVARDLEAARERLFQETANDAIRTFWPSTASFDAPPAFVFALWSNPALVSSWWGPEAPPPGDLRDRLSPRRHLALQHGAGRGRPLGAWHLPRDRPREAAAVFLSFPGVRGAIGRLGPAGRPKGRARGCGSCRPGFRTRRTMRATRGAGPRPSRSWRTLC